MLSTSSFTYWLLKTHRGAVAGWAAISRVLAFLVVCTLLLPYLWLSSHSQTGISGLPDLPYKLLSADQQPAATEDLVRQARSLVDHPGDASQLLDLSDFRWLDDGNATAGCSGQGQDEPPLLVVLVASDPKKVAQRNFIRETWGAKRPGLVLRFMVGLTDESRQKQLNQERRQHGDLVQGNFVDAYRNLTYKFIMSLKWVVYHCPVTPYVLKMDDDVVVNTPALLNFLQRDLSPHGARGLLLCEPVAEARARRSFRSKWRVTYSEYSAAYYPGYCFGWGVLFSPDVVLQLYREAQKPTSRFFWIDDVLVTGILAQRVGVRHASWDSYLLSKSEVERVISGESERHFLFGSLELSDNVSRQLWNHIAAHQHTPAPPQLQIAHGSEPD